MAGFLSKFFGQSRNETSAAKRLAEAKATLRDEQNAERRSALQRYIDQLTAEAVFDEVVTRDKQGPAIARARLELQALDNLLIAEPEITIAVQAIIGLAIEHGAVIYNAGSHIGCAAIYDLAARLIIQKLDTANPAPQSSLPEVRKRLLVIDLSPIAQDSATKRAWALRHAFDGIMEGFSSTAAPVAAESGRGGVSTSSRTVFVSHAARDRGIAEQLVQLLESTGIRCWIAPRDIQFGANYAEEIMLAIKSAGVMLVLLSKESNASQFVSNEIERGTSYGKRIVPVRLENVQPSMSLELFIGARQWIDFWDSAPDREQNFQRLVGALRT